jgi:RNA-directed DNA polymerase
MGYYKKVYSHRSLIRAWEKVYENGIQSQTRDDFIKYNKVAYTRTRTISDQLRERRFKFLLAEGFPIKRQGKKPRPIVKYPIPNSIVQRRILDILQEEPAIQKYYRVGTSFGGIEGRGVRDAIKLAHDSIGQGYKYFIRSDISDFFTNIRKQEVIKILSGEIKDVEFLTLLERALTVELANQGTLGKYKELFPSYERGVAQGCCLSPLFGNILLSDFDNKMNGRGIICLRYIDDFILLGKSESNVKRAFLSAQKNLSRHGLIAYDPLRDMDKAEYGMTEAGFDFLGCSIRPGIIVPNKKSRRRVLSKVDEVFKEGIGFLELGGRPLEKRGTLVKVLDNVNNILKGWGNQYSFCNDRRIYKQMDATINKKLGNFFAQYNEIKHRFEHDTLAKRRLLGVHLLAESKDNPIVERS